MRADSPNPADSPYNTGFALTTGSQRLAAAGCDTPRLDAELLLAHILGTSRASLLSHPERLLSPAEQTAWEHLLARRAQREPLAYLLGLREFFGLELAVDARVLTPRPETELLVERALQLGRTQEQPTIWDVGTGSGAIALALAANLPQAHIIASDLSAEALAVANTNRRRLGLESRVQLLRADLLQPTRGPIHLLVANLPYLSSTEYCTAMPEVSQYEPKLALEAGPTGTELIERLLAQAAALPNQPHYLLLEIGASQGPHALELARTHFPERPVTLARDLAGWDRLIEVSPPLLTAKGDEGRAQQKVSGLPLWQSPLTLPSPPVGRGKGAATSPPSPPQRGRGDGGEGPTHLLPPNAAGLALAAEALRRGEVVAFPTDTVYGLGADVFHETAVQALYEIKGRPEGKAIPLLLADADDLPLVAAEVPSIAKRLIARYWPGPLTLVLTARPEVPSIVRAGGATVAVRVPDDAVAQALIRATGAPLATTSANRSGACEALTAAGVVAQLGSGVHWVVDGGPSRGGVASTVVDLTVEPPLIRRVGALSAQTLQPLLQG